MSASYSDHFVKKKKKNTLYIHAYTQYLSLFLQKKKKIIKTQQRNNHKLQKKGAKKLKLSAFAKNIQRCRKLESKVKYYLEIFAIFICKDDTSFRGKRESASGMNCQYVHKKNIKYTYVYSVCTHLQQKVWYVNKMWKKNELAKRKRITAWTDEQRWNLEYLEGIQMGTCLGGWPQ